MNVHFYKVSYVRQKSVLQITAYSRICILWVLKKKINLDERETLMERIKISFFPIILLRMLCIIVSSSLFIIMQWLFIWLKHKTLCFLPRVSSLIASMDEIQTEQHVSKTILYNPSSLSHIKTSFCKMPELIWIFLSTGFYWGFHYQMISSTAV